MNTLIVGGTGILGSAIAKHLLAQGHKVQVMARGTSSVTRSLSPLLIRADRRDLASLEACLERASVFKWDLVVDLGAHGREDVIPLASVLCSRVCHLIAVSSTYIYDPNGCMPLREDATIASADVLGGYAQGKVEMETAYGEIFAGSDTTVTILRLPHVLGRMSALGIIPLHNRDPLLAARISLGKPLCLVAGGVQAVQFVSTEQVAHAIAVLAARSAGGGIYNCVDSSIISARTYYDIVARTLGQSLRVIEIPVRCVVRSSWGWSLSVFSRVVDGSALRESVGGLPSFDLQAMVRECLKHSRWDKQSAQEDPVDTVLEALEKGEEDLVTVLSALATSRPKSVVDLRMNRSPLPRVDL